MREQQILEPITALVKNVKIDVKDFITGLTCLSNIIMKDYLKISQSSMMQGDNELSYWDIWSQTAEANYTHFSVFGIQLHEN